MAGPFASDKRLCRYGRSVDVNKPVVVLYTRVARVGNFIPPI